MRTSENRTYGKRPRRKPLSDARRIAYAAISQARARDGYVREILDTLLAREKGASNEDRAYARVLALGATATRGALDLVIDRSLDRLSDIGADVRDCLRISLFELVYLRKPEYVVVSQGVELTRFASRHAAGLANAVLHRAVRDFEGFPYGDPDIDVGAFALSLGMPDWLTTELIIAHGRDAAADILATTLTAPPTYVHINRNLGEELARATVERLVAEPISAAPFGVDDCFVIGDTPALIASGLIEEERVIVMDAAAQAVVSLLFPHDGDVCLEVGTGRGAKSIAVMSDAVARGRAIELHGVDIHGYRCALASERLGKAGASNVRVHEGDARHLDEIEGLPPTFDRILIDAPCSGLGTMRRHPERCWESSLEEIRSLAGLGLELLAAAAGRVAEEGVLVYSTCTILPFENQDVVKAFLRSDAGAGFAPVDPTPALPPEFSRFVDDDGFLQLLPTEGGPDGHFAAVLRRGARS